MYPHLFEAFFVISNLVVESQQQIEDILGTTSLLSDIQRVKELCELTMKVLEMRNLDKNVVPYLWEMLDVLVSQNSEILDFFREAQGENLVELWESDPNKRIRQLVSVFETRHMASCPDEYFQPAYQNMCTS